MGSRGHRKRRNRLPLFQRALKEVEMIILVGRETGASAGLMGRYNSLIWVVSTQVHMCETVPISLLMCISHELKPVSKVPGQRSACHSHFGRRSYL